MKTREPRMAVLLPARLRIAGEWADVRIRNVSSRGMLLELSSPPLRGCYLEVARGRQRYTARVAWTEGNLCGVQVREMIHVDSLTGATSPRAMSVGDRSPGEGISADRRERTATSPARLVQFVLVSLGLATAGATLAHSTFEHLSGVVSQVSAAMTADLH